jgi:hypothetical protein
MRPHVKPPEEGLLWEWRAFGQIDASLAALVGNRPVRMGILCHPEEDTYLVSPTSNHNVKLRNYPEGAALKIKLLVAARPDSIELYSESAALIYRFPVGRRELDEAARLLEVEAAESSRALEEFSAAEFIRAIEEGSPRVLTLEVKKTRTQYDFDGGWVEVADVSFPRLRTQTISIQSPELEIVLGLLNQLRPGGGLQVMNYVEACRLWHE